MRGPSSQIRHSIAAVRRQVSRTTSGLPNRWTKDLDDPTYLLPLPPPPPPPPPLPPPPPPPPPSSLALEPVWHELRLGQVNILSPLLSLTPLDSLYSLLSLASPSPPPGTPPASLPPSDDPPSPLPSFPYSIPPFSSSFPIPPLSLIFLLPFSLTDPSFSPSGKVGSSFIAWSAIFFIM